MSSTKSSVEVFYSKFLESAVLYSKAHLDEPPQGSGPWRLRPRKEKMAPDCSICCSRWDEESGTFVRTEAMSTRYPKYPVLSDFQIAASGGCCVCRLIHTGIVNVIDAATSTEQTLQSFKEVAPGRLKIFFVSRQDSQEVTSHSKGPLLLELFYKTVSTDSASVTIEFAGTNASRARSRDYESENEKDSLVGDEIVPPRSYFGCRQLVAGSGSDVQAMSWLKRLLSICEATHPECRRTALRLPTRLIRVPSISDPEQYVRVIETDGTGTNLDCKFIALSYCWGRSGNVRLTLDNWKTLTTVGIPSSELPPLVQDAILFARQMSVELLWIDALCIIQDDRNDWNREAARMKDVYSAAWLTLAVASSKDTSVRFLSDTPRHIMRQNCGQIKGDNQVFADVHASVFQPRSSWRDNEVSRHHDTGPLHTRGWTLQEYMMSTRVVEYQPHETVFHCRKAAMCECGAGQISGIWSEPSALRSSWTSYLNSAPQEQEHQSIEPKTNMSQWSMWSLIMAEYSLRNVSQLSDRAFALAGLAEQFQSAQDCPDVYLAGHWQSHFPSSFLWTSKINKRVRIAHFPSWSFLSVDSPVLTGNGQRSAADPTTMWDNVATLRKVEPLDAAFTQFPGNLAVTGPTLVSLMYQNVSFPSRPFIIQRLESLPKRETPSLDCYLRCVGTKRDVRDGVWWRRARNIREANVSRQGSVKLLVVASSRGPEPHHQALILGHAGEDLRERVGTVEFVSPSITNVDARGHTNDTWSVETVRII